MALRLSTKSRYGTRAVCCLAQHYDNNNPVSIQVIAREEHIPLRYLEQIMTRLRRAGILVSTRGAHGGYKLNRPPDQINLNQIFRALEGNVKIVWCIDPDGKNRCNREASCLSKNLWAHLNQLILRTLKNITIQELIEGKVKDMNIEALLKGE